MAEAYRLPVGGPDKLIRFPGQAPHPSETCEDCKKAKADTTYPRDFCTKHDHVIRPKEAM